MMKPKHLHRLSNGPPTRMSDAEVWIWGRMGSLAVALGAFEIDHLPFPLALPEVL